MTLSQARYGCIYVFSFSPTLVENWSPTRSFSLDIYCLELPRGYGMDESDGSNEIWFWLMFYWWGAWIIPCPYCTVQD